MSDYFKQNATKCNFSTNESWVILNEIEQRIKAKIEAAGKPLKDWDINIYRGILTGYNEAFIIDEKKKDLLIAEDPKSAEIIRPLLRGRDIKRYSYEFADLYLITTFPSLKIDIEQYPAVKQHLISFGYDRLKQTGDKGARKRTNNQWFETQDSISYWEDFYRPKIIWIELTDNPNFCLDNDNYLINNTVFFISGDRLEYLVAYLNSKLCKWYFSRIAATSGVGTTRWIKIYIEQLRIPIRIETSIEDSLKELTLRIQQNKIQKLDTTALESLVDELIYKIFNFCSEEVKFIETQ